MTKSAADQSAPELLPAAEAMGISISGINPIRVMEALAQKIFNLIGRMDLPHRLRGVDVALRESDLPRLDFYLFFITELLQAIPAKQREGATLILDEFGGEPNLPLEFRRYMKRRNIPRHFNRVLTKRSKSEPLIQIADLVAGAIFRRDARGEADAFEMIQGKFVGLSEYH